MPRDGFTQLCERQLPRWQHDQPRAVQQTSPQLKRRGIERHLYFATIPLTLQSQQNIRRFRQFSFRSTNCMLKFTDPFEELNSRFREACRALAFENFRR